MMTLRDFERAGTKNDPRFVTQVRDISGDETFELTIAGPEPLVRRVLGDATIELTIDSRQSPEVLKREQDAAVAVQRKAMWSIAGLDKIDDLFKPELPSAQRENTVLMAVRPVRGEGTPFLIRVSGFTVPAGASVFFTGLFVFGTVGSVAPASGDQDLALRLFVPSGPVVSASRLPLTLIDFVTFVMPSPVPIPFVPVFQVFGFTTGVCGLFVASGA
jgi:hypothetical protein